MPKIVTAQIDTVNSSTDSAPDGVSEFRQGENSPQSIAEELGAAVKAPPLQAVKASTPEATAKADAAAIVGDMVNRKTFAIGINTKIVGKCDPQQLSYSGAWQNVSYTIEQLAAHIGKGHPWMPAQLNNGGERWQANANSADVLGIDIDSGMTIQQALDHPFVKAHCALVIESASSTPEHNKFRLVFPLAGTIEGWQLIRMCNCYLISLIGVADKACKDASRFFFGAQGRTPALIQSASLPDDFLDQVQTWNAKLEAIAAREQAQRANYLASIDTTDQANLVQQALAFIPPYTPGNGTYDDLIVMMAGVVNDLGSEGEALLEAWGGFGRETAKKVAGLSRTPNKKATVGTVFHLAKEYGFQFPKKQKSTRSKAKRSGNQTADSGASAPESAAGSIAAPYETMLDAPVTDNYKIGVMETRGYGKHKCEVFVPRLYCDFSVSKILESSQGGGFVLDVKYMTGSKLKQRQITIKSLDCVKSDKFSEALTKAVGTGITCTIRTAELQALLEDRKQAYYRAGGEAYRLAECVGQMPDGYWVFEDRQFTPKGDVCTEKDSGWVFNQDLISGDDASPSPKIVEPNPQALTGLANSLKLFYDAAALPSAWLTLGYAVMGLHRMEIMSAANSVAGLAIYGEKGGGKSLAQAAAASLYGLQDFSLSAVTPSKFAEHCKRLSGLPLQWDDPIPHGDKGGKIQAQVESALGRLYAGLARDVRGNNQTPKTIAAVSTNRVLGTGNTAIMTRLISFIFPKFAVNRQAGVAVKQAMTGASGGLPQLLAIPYPHESIVEQGNQLTEFLSESDCRNAQSLATLAHYTQAFCDLAGVEFDALTYIKTDVCPQANEQGSGKCSLEDFLEKLAIFHGENKVGEWNVLEYRDRNTNEEFLAVHMASVWESFNARFTPQYGSAIVTALAVEGGGRKNTNVRMVKHRDSVLAHQKAMVAWEMHLGDKPQALNRDGNPKCLLIPRAIAKKAGFFGGDGEPEEAAAQIDDLPVDDFEAQPVAPPTPVTTALPTGEWAVESAPATTKPPFTPTHTRKSDGEPMAFIKLHGDGVRLAVRDSNGKAWVLHPDELEPIGQSCQGVAA
jgi:hypothetical protein